MHDTLIDAHHGLAVTAVLFTAFWVLIVLGAPRRPVRLGRLGRPVFTGAMMSTGAAGITGLLLLASGKWLTMAFPWVGVAAVTGYGMAGAHSRRSLRSGQKASAGFAAVVQLLLLAAAFALMEAKPF
ncbi:hypothetical protein KNJ79_09215 [Sphingopyxis indica]|uniref:hypothetical protein n=1 Tax=Sphingopyxis indica TaxID=436663 RepID=UPI002938F3D2|nr:hypothetical protein [Sphingopyxis indica]WOF45029.1 hypothetical protein KNJ79_09215 [Sphingopyxis indica]